MNGLAVAPEPRAHPWSVSNNPKKSNLQNQIGVLCQMTEPVRDKDARAAIQFAEAGKDTCHGASI